MKKILWLTNVRFATEKQKSTGTWLQPLAELLTDYYHIYHVCCGDVRDVSEENVNNIKQFVIPNRKTLQSTQIPDHQSCADVKRILHSIQPDLIHVWGTESKWAYMKCIGIYESYKVLLDMQGYLLSCYEVYYAGLTISERIKCTGIKEILLPSRSLNFMRRRFKRMASVELTILKSYENISYQSDWIYNRLHALSLKAKLYPTKILLRDSFYNQRWMPTKNDSPVIFTSCSSSVPYKGLHILLKACSIIKKTYPSFVLYIAGQLLVKRFGIMSGYDQYLYNMISKFGLTNNIVFLGPLSAEQIVKYQLSSDVCVVPSLVESYCLALAEGMAVGVPSVVSYAAAMPTIADDKKDAIFYSSYDYVDCAEKILLLFNDKALAGHISKNARLRRMNDNGIDHVLNCQINIYNNIIA